MSFRGSSARLRRYVFSTSIGCAVLTVWITWGACELRAADPVTRVEEDWELVVATPDATTTAPQVTTVISPAANLDGVHAMFEMNFRSLPEFQPGGLHLQVWEGDIPFGIADHPNNATMSTNNETVTWTQSVELTGQNLVFEVSSGNSQTWGSFGGQNTLRASRPSAIANLDSYSSDVSINNTGVGFAGNRVTSLRILRVRRYCNDGTMTVDDTVRSVTLPQ